MGLIANKRISKMEADQYKVSIVKLINKKMKI